MTASRLTNLAAISAIVAGLMFILIQPLHPPDTLESVTTTAWIAIHIATLVMLTLFVVGITGIYASQVEKMGWLGLAGVVVLIIGLLLTAIGGVIEAFVQPLLAASNPSFVQAMLDMVEGRANPTDLGSIALVWNLSSAGFLVGTILFGVAVFRANVLSRPASIVFGLGLLLMAPVVGLIGGGGAPRLAAWPIGFGLAWLGYSLLTHRRDKLVDSMETPALAQPSEAGSA